MKIEERDKKKKDLEQHGWTYEKKRKNQGRRGACPCRPRWSWPRKGRREKGEKTNKKWEKRKLSRGQKNSSGKMKNKNVAL